MLEFTVRRARIAGALFVLLVLLPVRAALADYRAWPAPFPARTISAIEAALNKSFAETRAPGVVVGIWIPGEGTYVATKGVASLKSRKPMRAVDHFRVGSITKTFTATALPILADEGKLALDDPVSKYVAWVPDGNWIALRMLTDMTSGLCDQSQSELGV